MRYAVCLDERPAVDSRCIRGRLTRTKIMYSLCTSLGPAFAEGLECLNRRIIARVRVVLEDGLP
jgi:hypothetical protein